MAKHMETMEESCSNLWKLLDSVNKGFKGNAEDAKQYHDIIASLYKLKGLEMAAQYEEEQGGASQRGGSYRGGSYDNGGRHSGLYWEPWMQGGSYDHGGNSYGRGGSYDGHSGSYNQGGGSYGYGGSYGGGSYEGGSYDGYGGGTSGRYQPRNAMGQYKADGRSNRGGSYGSSYHSQDEMIQDMRERMQDADPETQRAYRKVIRDMQDM